MRMFESLKYRFSYRHKNNKFTYYVTGFIRQIIPAFFFRMQLRRKLASISRYDADYIKRRVNYYNKLGVVKQLSPAVQPLTLFKYRKKNKTYFFDSYEYTRYFRSHFRVNFLFGDITIVPDEPTIVKSRPVHGD